MALLSILELHYSRIEFCLFIIFFYYHCKAALKQFVLYKVLYN